MGNFISKVGNSNTSLFIHFDQDPKNRKEKKAQSNKIKELTSKLALKIEGKGLKVEKTTIKDLREVTRIHVGKKEIQVFFKKMGKPLIIKNKEFEKFETGDLSLIQFSEVKNVVNRRMRRHLGLQTKKDRILNAFTGIKNFFRRIFIGHGSTLKEKEIVQVLAGNPTLLERFHNQPLDLQLNDLCKLLKETVESPKVRDALISQFKNAATRFRSRSDMAYHLQVELPKKIKLTIYDDDGKKVKHEGKFESWEGLNKGYLMAKKGVKDIEKNIPKLNKLIKKSEARLAKHRETIQELKQERNDLIEEGADTMEVEDQIDQLEKEERKLTELIPATEKEILVLKKREKAFKEFIPKYEKLRVKAKAEGEKVLNKELDLVKELSVGKSVYMGASDLVNQKLLKFGIAELAKFAGSGEPLGNKAVFRITREENSEYKLEVFSDAFLEGEFEKGEKIEAVQIFSGLKQKDILALTNSANTDLFLPDLKKDKRPTLFAWNKRRKPKKIKIPHEGQKAILEKDFHFFMRALLTEKGELSSPNWKYMRLQGGLEAFFKYFDHIKGSSLKETDKEIALGTSKELLKQTIELTEMKVLSLDEAKKIRESLNRIEKRLEADVLKRGRRPFKGFRRKLQKSFTNSCIDKDKIEQVKTKDISEISKVSSSKLKMPSLDGLDKADSVASVLNKVEIYALESLKEGNPNQAGAIVSKVLLSLPLPRLKLNEGEQQFWETLSIKDQERVSKALSQLAIIACEANNQKGGRPGNSLFMSLASAKYINRNLELLEFKRIYNEAIKKKKTPPTAYPSFSDSNYRRFFSALDASQIGDPYLRQRLENLNLLQGQERDLAFLLTGINLKVNTSVSFSEISGRQTVFDAKQFVDEAYREYNIINKKLKEDKQKLKAIQKRRGELKRAHTEFKAIFPKDNFDNTREGTIAFIKSILPNKNIPTGNQPDQSLLNALDNKEAFASNVSPYGVTLGESLFEILELNHFDKDKNDSGFYKKDQKFLLKNLEERLENVLDPTKKGVQDLMKIVSEGNKKSSSYQALEDFFDIYANINQINAKENYLIKDIRKAETKIKKIQSEEPASYFLLGDKGKCFSAFVDKIKKKPEPNLYKDSIPSYTSNKEAQQAVSSKEYSKNLANAEKYAGKLFHAYSDFGEKGILSPSVVTDKTIGALFWEQACLTTDDLISDSGTDVKVADWKKGMQKKWDGKEPYFRHKKGSCEIVKFSGGTIPPFSSKAFEDVSPKILGKHYTTPFSKRKDNPSAEDACIEVENFKITDKFLELDKGKISRTASKKLAMATMGKRIRFTNLLEAFSDVTLGTNPEIQQYLFENFFKDQEVGAGELHQLLKRNKGEFVETFSEIFLQNIEKYKAIGNYQAVGFLYLFAGTLQKYIPEDVRGIKKGGKPPFLLKNIIREGFEAASKLNKLSDKQTLIQYSTILLGAIDPAKLNKEMAKYLILGWSLNQTSPAAMPYPWMHEAQQNGFDLLVPTALRMAKKDTAFSKEVAERVMFEFHPEKKAALKKGKYPVFEFKTHTFFFDRGILQKKGEANPEVELPGTLLANPKVFGEVLDKEFRPTIATLSAVEKGGVTFPAYTFTGPGKKTFRIVDFGSAQDPLIEMRDPENSNLWLQKMEVGPEVKKIGFLQRKIEALKEKFPKIGAKLDRFKQIVSKPFVEFKQIILKPIENLKEAADLLRKAGEVIDTIKKEESEVLTQETLWVETGKKKRCLGVNPKGEITFEGEIGGKGNIQNLKDKQSGLFILNVRKVFSKSKDFQLFSEFTPLSKLRILGKKNGEALRVEIPSAHLVFEKKGKEWVCVKGPDSKNSYAGYAIAPEQGIPELHGIKNALVFKKGEETRVLISERRALRVGKAAFTAKQGLFTRFRIALEVMRTHLAVRYSFFNKMGRWNPEKFLDPLMKDVIFDPSFVGGTYGFTLAPSGKITPDLNLEKSSPVDAVVFIEALFIHKELEAAYRQIPSLLTPRGKDLDPEMYQALFKILAKPLELKEMAEKLPEKTLLTEFGSIFGDNEAAKLAAASFFREYIADPKHYAFFAGLQAKVLKEGLLQNILLHGSDQEKKALNESFRHTLEMYYDFELKGVASSIPFSMHLTQEEEQELISFIIPSLKGELNAKTLTEKSVRRLPKSDRMLAERFLKVQRLREQRTLMHSIKSPDEVKKLIKSIQKKINEGKQTQLTPEEVGIHAIINSEKESEMIFGDLTNPEEIIKDSFLFSFDKYFTLANDANLIPDKSKYDINKIDGRIRYVFDVLSEVKKLLNDPEAVEKLGVDSLIEDALLEITLGLATVKSNETLWELTTKKSSKPSKVLSSPLIDEKLIQSNIHLKRRHTDEELKKIKDLHLKSLDKVVKNEKEKQKKMGKGESHVTMAQKNKQIYEKGWKDFEQNYDMYLGSLPEGKELEALTDFDKGLNIKEKEFLSIQEEANLAIEKILLSLPRGANKKEVEEARRQIQKVEVIPDDVLEIYWLEGRLDKLGEFYPDFLPGNIKVLENLISQKLQAQFQLQCLARGKEKISTLTEKAKMLKKAKNENKEAIRKEMGQDCIDLKDQLLGFHYETVIYEHGAIKKRKIYQGYDPNQDKALLLMSVRGNFRFRAPQLRSMQKMLKDPNCVEHLIMGAGKSSVIFPYLALMKANGRNLSTLITTTPLFDEFKDTVARKNLALFQQKSLIFEWERKSNPDDYVKTALDYSFKFKKAIRERQFVMTTRQNLDSLEDTLELLGEEVAEAFKMGQLRSEKGKGLVKAYQAVKNLHSLMDQYMAKLDDEMDFNNDPIFSTIFTTGEPKSFEDHEVDAGIAFFRTLSRMEGEKPLLNLFKNGQNGVLPEVRQAYIDKILKQVLKENPYFGADEKGVLKVLTQDIFNSVLGKSSKIHYIRSEKNPMLVVPTREKDVPKENSQFGHPLEVVAFTAVDYLQNGIHDKVLGDFLTLHYKSALEEIKSMRIKPGEKAKIKLKNTRSGELVKRLLDIDLSFYEANEAHFDNYIRKLQEKLNQKPQLILNFMEEVVFKEKILYENSIENTSADYLSFGQSHAGASGTMNENMFDQGPNLRNPSREVFRDIQTDIKTVALLLSKLDHVDVFQGKGDHNALYSNGEFKAFWKFIEKMHEKNKAPFELICDAGGLVRFNDKKAAELILKEGQNLTVKYREEGELKVLSTEKAVGMLEYLGQALARGTDPKLTPKAKGLFTICEGMTREELAQAVWRLRQIDKDQEAFLVMGSWMLAHMGLKKEDAPDLTDVIAYVENNSLAKSADRNFRSLQQQIQGRIKRFQRRERAKTSDIGEDFRIMQAFKKFRVKLNTIDYRSEAGGKVKTEPPIEFFQKYIKGAKKAFEKACRDAGIPEEDYKTVLKELTSYEKYLGQREGIFTDEVKSGKATDDLGKDMQKEAETEVEAEVEKESEVEEESSQVQGGAFFAHTKEFYLSEDPEFNLSFEEQLKSMNNIIEGSRGGLSFLQKFQSFKVKDAVPALRGVIDPAIEATRNFSFKDEETFGARNSQPIDKIFYSLTSHGITPYIISREDEDQMLTFLNHLETYKILLNLFKQNPKIMSLDHDKREILSHPKLWEEFLKPENAGFISDDQINRLTGLIGDRQYDFVGLLKEKNFSRWVQEKDPFGALSEKYEYKNLYSIKEELESFKELFEDKELRVLLTHPFVKESLSSYNPKKALNGFVKGMDDPILQDFMKKILPFKGNPSFVKEMKGSFLWNSYSFVNRFEAKGKELLNSKNKFFMSNIWSGGVTGGREFGASLSETEKDRLLELDVQLRVLAGEVEFNDEEKEAIRNWLEGIGNDYQLIQFGNFILDRVLVFNPAVQKQFKKTYFFKLLEEITGHEFNTLENR